MRRQVSWDQISEEANERLANLVGMERDTRWISWMRDVREELVEALTHNAEVTRLRSQCEHIRTAAEQEGQLLREELENTRRQRDEWRGQAVSAQEKAELVPGRVEEMDNMRRWCSVLEEARELWVIRKKDADKQTALWEYRESEARRECDQALDRVGALLREVRALRKLTPYVVVSDKCMRLMAEWDEVAVTGILDE